MEIRSLPLSDAALIKTTAIGDHRGSFARFFCLKELSSVIGKRQIVNVNHSCTNHAGVIRGLHFQCHPHQEMKFVRCLSGAVYDVIVDMRQESPTFLKWHSQELDSKNMDMICVPEGFAHGFQSLEDASEIIYLSTAFYAPDAEGGLRFDDPALNIQWPLKVTGISDKDASHPLIEIPSPKRQHG